MEDGSQFLVLPEPRLEGVEDKFNIAPCINSSKLTRQDHLRVNMLGLDKQPLVTLSEKVMESYGDNGGCKEEYCCVQIMAEDEVAGDTIATGRVEVDSETE